MTENSTTTIKPAKDDLMRSLRDAISQASVDVVRNFIEQGLDPREIYCNETFGWNGNALHMFSAIHHTSYTARDAEMLELFLALGVDINAANRKGCTPLHTAVQVRDLAQAGIEVIKNLVAHGAEINASDPEGRTALHFAALAGNWNAYHALCNMGADRSRKDNEGNDATEIWQMLSGSKISRVCDEVEIGYRLTEVFNFETRIYTCVTRNMETNAEAVTVQPMTDLAGTELISRARNALERRGGNADYLDKPRPGLLQKP